MAWQRFERIRDGEWVDATRYEPGLATFAVAAIADVVGCAHLREPNEVIELFSWRAELTVRDPRHPYDGADARIYAGDWVVYDIDALEVVPSLLFDVEYRRIVP